MDVYPIVVIIFFIFWSVFYHILKQFRYEIEIWSWEWNIFVKVYINIRKHWIMVRFYNEINFLFLCKLQRIRTNKLMSFQALNGCYIISQYSAWVILIFCSIISCINERHSRKPDISTLCKIFSDGVSKISFVYFPTFLPVLLYLHISR